MMHGVDLNIFHSTLFGVERNRKVSVGAVELMKTSLLATLAATKSMLNKPKSPTLHFSHAATAKQHAMAVPKRSWGFDFLLFGTNCLDHLCCATLAFARSRQVGGGIGRRSSGARNKYK